ncbi:cytochrome P450 2D26-like [Aplysia californica]|uniref:Cytochrome P450 2D26-like n=1 Tax=Aplysia californica TaxID=6500 RepID=A0ABM1W2X6_APLCA|nr:cytochrome P450 2D26-like [Aplysia californica]
MISEYLIALVVLAAIFLIGSKIKNRKPTTVPGPSILQGLWDFLQSMRHDSLHLTAAKWADQYGDIVSVNTLLRQVVFVNSSRLARKLVCDPSTREVSNDRPPTFMGRVFFYDSQDILLGRYGKDLFKRRKIFHQVLKFYGQGVHNFETLMKSTSKELCHRLTQYEGDIPISIELARYIRWVVALLLKGPETCEQDLDAMLEYIDRTNECFIFEKEVVLETVPFAPHIPGLGLKKLVGDLKVAQEVMRQRFFLAIRETYQKGERTGIVTDMLDQQTELKEKGNASEMPDELIIGLVQDIAAAAYATTVATLKTLFLQIVVDQKLQDRIHAEICEVIGDESPSFEHKRHMPYTEAAILETLRYSSVVPLLLPHYACGDIHFEGHFIPKGTFLILNAFYFHHRDDAFEDPWKFKPERFLDSEGQLLDPEHPTRQKLIPFGTGKRACPGESFARIRVFFIVVTLLQKYRFLPPVDDPLPSVHPRDWKIQAVISPDEYKCRMEPRLKGEAGTCQT